MSTKEKIDELRRIMKRENLEGYIISGTDPHNSEYLPLPWQQRRWFSGFTGSFGTIVVTMDHVGLWSDTRYFIQAEVELQDSGITLHKLGIPEAEDYHIWLSRVLKRGDKVGIDAFCISVNSVRGIKELFKTKGIELVEKVDLIGEIWLDRPALPLGKITIHPVERSGMSTAKKISKIRETLDINNAKYIIFTALDEIAWLFNIRCNDISYNPVAISYAIIGVQEAYLFIKQEKISHDIAQELSREGIVLYDYHHLSLFMEELSANKEEIFLVDPVTCNYAIYNQINKKFNVKAIASPIVLLKAIKNSIELEGFRLACIKDGIAMTKFFYWLEQNLHNRQITELEAAEQLARFRAEDNDYVSDSFNYISAYGKNAALPHYSATLNNNSYIIPEGLYLIDSGAQYTHGTTDITRTVPVGKLTYLEKEDYTLVLKGMIDLSLLIFPKGTRGCNMDIVARLPLYEKLRNFGHGTGHGVGHYLNVHEGPQSIRPDLRDQPILPGMVTSNEPGIYREGKHGVRHENLIVCRESLSNEFGEFYNFETLTLCYFDSSAVIIDLLGENELKWLNDYNQRVYNELSPYLSDELNRWLSKKTKPIAAV